MIITACARPQRAVTVRASVRSAWSGPSSHLVRVVLVLTVARDSPLTPRPDDGRSDTGGVVRAWNVPRATDTGSLASIGANETGGVENPARGVGVVTGGRGRRDPVARLTFLSKIRRAFFYRVKTGSHNSCFPAAFYDRQYGQAFCATSSH
jgi:hypothetical protein